MDLIVSDSRDPVDESTRRLCPWDFPGKNTGVGCHFFFQGVFLTPSLSFTISHSLLKLRSIESVMPSNHLILCHSFLLPSILPSIRVFSNESAGLNPCLLHCRWILYLLSHQGSPLDQGLNLRWDRQSKGNGAFSPSPGVCLLSLPRVC